jgi:hypothetical protein
VQASAHEYKYSLAYVVEGECVLRYDNEAGKGDQIHSANADRPCKFTTSEPLLIDFWSDVGRQRFKMRIVTLSVASRDDVSRRARAAFKGKQQGAIFRSTLLNCFGRL